MNFDSIFQKLRENPKENAEEAVRLLIKIAENVLKNPHNLKVRTLQKSNGTVRGKILGARGGVESLQLMGFVENDTSFILPQNHPPKRLEEFRNCLLKFKANDVKESEPVATTSSEPETAGTSTQPLEEDPDLHYGELRVSKFVLPPITPTFSHPFLRQIELKFHDALRFDDKDAHRRAKAVIPLASLEIKAQQSLRSLQEHIKRNKLPDLEVSIQDMLLSELLFWFKNDFFSWVDTVPCTKCGSKTVMSHMSTDAKDFLYTDRVEVHRCESCGHLSNFPRYNDLNILLETRRGRCGEWAQVFTLFCRALDWDARYVIDELDHVWTEVYSATQKRWIHCDPCENVCDTPLMYESGWNKKLTYVMAYSPDEIQDVTWRYSGHHKEVLKRRRSCKEDDLVSALVALRERRQKDYSQARKNYLTRRLLMELIELMVERTPKDNEHRGRTSGSIQWRQSRGEVKNETNFIWMILNHHIRNNSLSVKYSSAKDQYEYVLGDGTSRIISDWTSGAFSYTNIFRKEETDWKIVYLARSEGSDSGQISWKFQLDNSDKVIDSVSLKFGHQLYENGTVDVKLISGNVCVELSKGGELWESKQFSGLNSITVTATLQGGKGNVAWQHAQLFRQPFDSPDCPFQISFTFKTNSK